MLTGVSTYIIYNMFPSAARTLKAKCPTLAPDPVHIDSDTCIGSNVCQSDLMERVTGHYLQLVTSLVETVRQLDSALQRRSHRNILMKTNKTGGTSGSTVRSSSPSTVLTSIATGSRVAIISGRPKEVAYLSNGGYPEYLSKWYRGMDTKGYQGCIL
jgi:hypothetical protein